jgi:hypothetical protein
MMSKRNELVRSFASAVNRHSLENDSNTPDFILAEFLIGCLHVFGTATRAREDWYGHHHAPGQDAAPPSAAASAEPDPEPNVSMPNTWPGLAAAPVASSEPERIVFPHERAAPVAPPICPETGEDCTRPTECDEVCKRRLQPLAPVAPKEPNESETHYLRRVNAPLTAPVAPDDLIARLKFLHADGSYKDRATLAILVEEAAAALAEVREELAQVKRRLEIERRRHAFGMRDAGTEHDPPSSLRTLGFWPDCSCGECWAIHCLDEAMSKQDKAEADAARGRELLEPFAKRWDYFEGKQKACGEGWRDDDLYADDDPSEIYLGQLRAARAYLSQRKGK